jgi:hypothetical protein
MACHKKLPVIAPVVVSAISLPLSILPVSVIFVTSGEVECS